MKKILFVILSFLFISRLYPQLTTEWTAKYTRALNTTETVVKSLPDNAGNIYTAFDTYNNSGPGNIVLVKYNSAGKELWSANYSNLSNLSPRFFDMVSDNSGNIYLTGEVSGIYTDIVTLKYNSEGTLLWSTIYNSAPNGDDTPYKMESDNSGNIIIGATTKAGNDQNILLLKYNSMGVLQWDKQFDNGMNRSDRLSALKTDINGNISREVIPKIHP